MASIAVSFDRERHNRPRIRVRYTLFFSGAVEINQFVNAFGGEIVQVINVKPDGRKTINNYAAKDVVGIRGVA